MSWPVASAAPDGSGGPAGTPGRLTHTQCELTQGISLAGKKSFFVRIFTIVFHVRSLIGTRSPSKGSRPKGPRNPVLNAPACASRTDDGFTMGTLHLFSLAFQEVLFTLVLSLP